MNDQEAHSITARPFTDLSEKFIFAHMQTHCNSSRGTQVIQNVSIIILVTCWRSLCLFTLNIRYLSLPFPCHLYNCRQAGLCVEVLPEVCYLRNKKIQYQRLYSIDFQDTYSVSYNKGDTNSISYNEGDT